LDFFSNRPIYFSRVIFIDPTPNEHFEHCVSNAAGCVDVQKENGGALVTVPLKDDSNRVFGVLAVDTVNDQRNKNGSAKFTSSDVSFYEVR